MADAGSAAAPAASLGDFFAKKKTKKAKGTNLNNNNEAKKPEAKKPKSTDAEQEGWVDEVVVPVQMKVEAAGKLTRDEDKKDEEDVSKVAWGSVKGKPDPNNNPSLNERRFPTLAKSVGASTNINIDDGSQPTVNIKTSKNAFAALNNDDDDDGEVKRPKEIKPAMVKKIQGERETVAIQREKDKYAVKKDTGKKEPKKSDDSGDEDSEEEEAEEPAEPVVEVKKEKKAKKADVEEKKPAIKEEEEETEEEKEADLKIPTDMEACKAKYAGRKKPFPAQLIPKSEREEEKENKPKAQQAGKKKKFVVEEEDFGKKNLIECPW